MTKTQKQNTLRSLNYIIMKKENLVKGSLILIGSLVGAYCIRTIAVTSGLELVLGFILLFTLSESLFSIGRAIEGERLSTWVLHLIGAMFFLVLMATEKVNGGAIFGQDYFYEIDYGYGVLKTDVSPGWIWYLLYAIPVTRIFVLQPILAWKIHENLRFEKA